MVPIDLRTSSSRDKRLWMQSVGRTLPFLVPANKVSGFDAYDFKLVGKDRVVDIERYGCDSSICPW